MKGVLGTLFVQLFLNLGSAINLSDTALSYPHILMEKNKPPIYSLYSRASFSANRQTLHKHGNAQLLTLIDLRAYSCAYIYKHMISDWFQTHMLMGMLVLALFCAWYPRQ